MMNLRKKVLGLDIGSRTVKGAVLSRKGSEVHLQDFLFHDLRQDPAAPEEDRLDTISALIDRRGFKNLSVAGCIDDKEVQVMLIALPEMPDGEIEAAVRNKIEAKTGGDSSNLSIDFIRIPPAVGSREIMIRAYYTNLGAVKLQADALEYARLRPLSIESCLQATIEALRFNEYINERDAAVVVDIGETHTSIGLVIGGVLAQLNALRVGSGDINENLSSSFKCDYEASEKMKIAYRLEKSDPGAAENLNRIIEDGYYQIILGIHDTVSYYKAAFKEQTITSLLLTGGGANKDGLASLVSQSLSIPATVPNALRKIQIFDGNDERREALPALASQLHSAIGLALRGV
jgi:type IV pilus assembly protein PilM